MRYVVVDIETTGGKPNGNDITEIGVVHVEHRKVVHTWSSFVRPDRSIPLNIQRLTGITDEMVADAPTFSELAPTLLKHLSGDVFVAHSVNFDYSFIELAFKEAGYSWRMDKLCTVKYSRQVFPEFGRYSLANLARELEIYNENPHRALSDALTAADVLVHCLNADYDEKILRDGKTGLLKRIQLPDLMDAKYFDDLPKEGGVYQFRDAFGMPLYIGKAKNIKSRITQHFSTDQGSTKFHRLMKECVSIVYDMFPNDTLSLIYEDHLIRQHWPPLNKAQKAKAHKYGVYAFENGKGETRWVVQKSASHGALKKFGSYVSAMQWMTLYLRESEGRGLNSSEALKEFLAFKARKFLFKLDPELGAIFISGGHVVGVYRKNDYLYNEKWVRDHFESVTSSPTIDAIVLKRVEQAPENMIEF
jgi:DNA polymerase-3 subunit epsilon